MYIEVCFVNGVQARDKRKLNEKWMDGPFMYQWIFMLATWL